jgi:hypothetical protein
VFDHLLGDELRRVVHAQHGPRPSAFQARYQKGGGGAAWSVRLVAVGFTAVALTAGGAAFAAVAAGPSQADPVSWAGGIRRAVSSFGQHQGGAAGTRGGGSDRSGKPLSTPQLGQPLPAGTQPQSQSGRHSPSPSPNDRASSDPSHSGDGDRFGGRRPRG